MYEYLFYYANKYFSSNYYLRLKNYSMFTLGYINNMYLLVRGLI